MSGTAQQGIDYTISPSGSVTIPANRSSATVSFHATAKPAGANKKPQGKTATLTLQRGSGYKLGYPQESLDHDRIDSRLVRSFHPSQLA